MEVEVLGKDKFIPDTRGEATVRFASVGVVYFNRKAVEFLNLMEKGKKGYFCVHICRDLKIKSDFAVFKDPSGWGLREGVAGGAQFNCAGLARHVIDATWEKRQSHPVGAEKPCSMTFRIARLPLDDGKNKDVFALLRKKE